MEHTDVIIIAYLVCALPRVRRPITLGHAKGQWRVSITGLSFIYWLPKVR